MKIHPCSILKILLVICFLFSDRSSAQTILKKGYYLPKTDSTPVSGYFNLSSTNLNSVAFYKMEDKDKTLELYPEDVSAIHTDAGDFILPIRLKLQDGFIDIFANRIFNAEVSLFEGRANGDDVFFLYSNKIPELKKINKQAPEVFLRTYLGPKCGPKKVIRYAKDNLIEALKKYAICSGAEFKTPSKNHFKFNLALGIRAGYYRSSPKVSGFYGNEFNPISGPVYGGDLQMGLSRTLKARVGFVYSQSTFLKEEGIKFDYTFRGWPFTFSDPVQFSYTTFEIPVELIWMLNKSKKISPFAGLGINYIYTTTPTVDQYFTVPDDFNYGFYSFDEVDILNSLVGQMKVDKHPPVSWQLKAGAVFRLQNKSFFELGFRYAPRKQSYYMDASGIKYPFIVNSQDWLELTLAYYLPIIK